MSQSEEVRQKELTEKPRSAKCRIPLRLPQPRIRTQRESRLTKLNVNPAEPSSRTRSTSRQREDKPNKPAVFRASITERRQPTQNNIQSKKIPVKKTPYSKQRGPTVVRCKRYGLPDQDTIQNCEDWEIKEDVNIANLSELPEEDYVTNNLDKVKENWEEKMKEFQNMKGELDSRQKTIMEVYASLSKTYKVMSAFGQPVNMPSTEELKIMNVAKMSPSQLLQLCAGTPQNRGGIRPVTTETHGRGHVQQWTCPMGRKEKEIASTSSKTRTVTAAAAQSSAA